MRYKKYINKPEHPYLNYLFQVSLSTSKSIVLSCISSVPKGLEDVSKYPHLFATLLESDKWSEGDIAKLAGNNLIRVFKEVEAVSKTPTPPTEK